MTYSSLYPTIKESLCFITGILYVCMYIYNFFYNLTFSKRINEFQYLRNLFQVEARNIKKKGRVLRAK